MNERANESAVGRHLTLAYGLVVYAGFLALIVFFIGFLANAGLPKTIDSAPAQPQGTTGPSLVVDLALIAAFGVQHSVMARERFKRAWTRIVPVAAERSTFVLASSLAIVTLCWLWRPMPDVVWRIEGFGALVVWALYALGWILVVASTFMIDHFEFVGLRQVFFHATRRTDGRAPELRTPALYVYVRHPMYVGFVVTLWAAPRMTVGHALLAAGFTTYILVGVRYEEAHLARVFGERYREYRRNVPMLVPFGHHVVRGLRRLVGA